MRDESSSTRPDRAASSGAAIAGRVLAAIELPVADRFGHMRAKNIGAAGKIGDGPRHAQDAVHRTRGELQQINRVLQHRLIFGGEPAHGIRTRLIEMRVTSPGAL